MGRAKIIRPDRSQLRWDYIDLEALLPLDMSLGWSGSS